MSLHVYVQFRRYQLPAQISDGTTSYELKSWLAGGGNSAVFKAHMYTRGTFVGAKAVKVLKQLDHVRVDRFRNELRLLKELDHERITKFYGEGEVKVSPFPDVEGDRGFPAEDGTPLHLLWVSMDLGGLNLRRAVQESGPVTGAAFLTAARDMCDAVAYLHGKEVLHRDIKPENFIFDPGKRERVTMIDFGIAKYAGEDVADRPFDNLTKEKEFVGPQAFSSPEQLAYANDKRTRVDYRSDLFQLGKVLWFLATGIVSAGVPSRKADPFGGKLHALVSELLCDDPDDRPDTAAQVRQRLAEF